MNLAAFDPGIVLPPLLAGLLVLASHVPLGRLVLRKGIVFIDLAIAQIAGLGVIAAHVLFGETNSGWLVQLAAFGAALAAALVFRLCERRWPERQEALIGSAFVLAASLGVLLLANDPHAGEQMRELLVGQILWVRYEQLWPLALLSAAMLALWPLLRLDRHPLAFYLALAVMVTASVQVVGVYLVFASLILPALAIGERSGRRGLAWGYGIGAIAYGAGLFLSAMQDWPAGPVIVLALAAAALAAPRQTG